jgi:hypothetical protein
MSGLKNGRSCDVAAPGRVYSTAYKHFAPFGLLRSTSKSRLLACASYQLAQVLEISSVGSFKRFSRLGAQYDYLNVRLILPAALLLESSPNCILAITELTQL